MLKDMRLAIGFLTVFPLAPGGAAQMGPARAYFPLIGLVLGATLAGLDFAARQVLSPRARRRGADGTGAGLLPSHRPGAGSHSCGAGLRGETGPAAAGSRRPSGRGATGSDAGHTHGRVPGYLRRAVRRVLPREAAGDPPGHACWCVRRSWRHRPTALEVDSPGRHPQRGTRQPADRVPMPLPFWNVVYDGRTLLYEEGGLGDGVPGGYQPVAGRIRTRCCRGGGRSASWDRRGTPARVGLSPRPWGWAGGPAGCWEG